ncbi:MAG: hypothetical protein MUO62_09415 [Anaerolineales bacterium]|nr:hypothetical protein [Anaerolineales bacterium]
MTIRILGYLGSFLLFSLAACTPVELQPPPASPQPLRVEITPSLEPLFQEKIQNCALQNPRSAVFLDVVPSASLDPERADIIIQIGEPSKGPAGFAVQLGWEEIILIAHPDVEIQDLTLAKIRGIYTASPPSLQSWTYPENHEIRRFFDQIILGNEPISPFTHIAPQPGDMIAAVSQEPGSIGYALQSWIPGDIQTFTLGNAVQTALRQPILARSLQEPAGPARDFLICLQNLEE